MITILGSLNLDLVARVPRFPAPGETLIATAFRTECGGKGGNQAVAVARMGVRATLIGAIGDDGFGVELLTGLSMHGVDIRHVRRGTQIPSGNALILLDPAGQNQIVLSPGANATVCAADLDACADLILASQMVLAQLETPMEATEAAFRLARAAGVPTLLNPAPAQPLSDALMQLCDWIVPNETEATQLTGIRVENPATAAQAAQFLRGRSPGSGVVITLGAQGAWIDSATLHHHQPGFQVVAQDTVGAGDTFVGAFAAELVRGASEADALRFACAAAALSVTRPGTQSAIPSLSEVNQFLSRCTAEIPVGESGENGLSPMSAKRLSQEPGR